MEGKKMSEKNMTIGEIESVYGRVVQAYGLIV